MKKRRWLALVLLAFLTGCNSQSTVAATFTPFFSPSPQIITSTPTSEPAPTSTPLPLVSSACSPLQGIIFDDIRFITSYAYSVKYPFSEGPEGDKNHPAIDLGFFRSSQIPHYTGPELSTDDGFPIQSVLPGKVVETVEDLYPYGNMILIETPLDSLTPEFLAKLNIPEPLSKEEKEIRFPCDRNQTPISWSDTSRSLYILYAHMKEPSTLSAGTQVQCGEVIGAIGATGNTSVSVEHLHLEMRVGPSNAKFGTISAYISSSTEEERYNYCIWALSEEFQSIDPALLW
jgi:murein DD-endopeptidase MepM/ murein hydrolase activator NlpD